jgi:hypothetical protein
MRSLRHRLTALLHQVLADVEERPAEPIVLRVEDELAQARLVLGPAGEGVTDQGKYPGSHFSPTERLIWNALADGPRLGKQIAAAIGQEYDARLKVILRNLVERGVIDTTDAGYSRCDDGGPE